MHLQNLLNSIARDLELPSLDLNPSGVCQFTVDGHMTVIIEEDSLENSVHLYAGVGRVPDYERELFYAELLQAQLFHREIGEGCALGLHAESGEIILCRKLGISNLDEASFSNNLSEFINWADYWMEKLNPLKVTEGGESVALETAGFIRP